MGDDFTPRDRGLLAGHAWAQSPVSSRDQVQEVAKTGVVPDDVRGLVTTVSLSSVDDAFWEGFAHGVRAFVAEIGTGSGSN